MIVALLQGDDPAVEKVGRSDPLTPEVVDQECSAVCLELVGCLVDAGARAKAELELLDRQLAARDQQGAANSRPSAVQALGTTGPERGRTPIVVGGRVLVLDDLVDRRVEDTDNLPAGFDRVGNQDVATPRNAESFRQRRLPITGRPEDEE